MYRRKCGVNMAYMYLHKLVLHERTRAHSCLGLINKDRSTTHTTPDAHAGAKNLRISSPELSETCDNLSDASCHKMSLCVDP